METLFRANCSSAGEIFRFTDEAFYSGSRNGDKLPAGKGCMWYSVSDCIYVGGWRNGLRYGEGKMVWGNGDCYEGYWDEDEMSGTGTFTRADKSSYSGTWKKGSPDGRGTMQHTSGKQYEGTWVAGKMEGEGKFVFEGGQVYEGSWKAGEMADSEKRIRLIESQRKGVGILPSLDDTGRRSSQGKGFRTSLFQITDFEHSYQTYPTNFKDYVVFALLLFFCGLGMYLVQHST